jgi:hypothetical protein
MTKNTEERLFKIEKEDITSLIMLFLEIRYRFDQDYKQYAKTRVFVFSSLDNLERDMFLLKAKTHNIFRSEKESKKKKIISSNEELFDLIIASIFHELLHLKEYVYALEVYTDKYFYLESSFKKAKVEISESDFVKYSHRIISEARAGLPPKASEVKDLFEDAFTHLKKFITQYKNNNTFIRSLFIDREILDKYIK